MSSEENKKDKVDITKSDSESSQKVSNEIEEKENDVEYPFQDYFENLEKSKKLKTPLTQVNQDMESSDIDSLPYSSKNRIVIESRFDKAMKNNKFMITAGLVSFGFVLLEIILCMVSISNGSIGANAFIRLLVYGNFASRLMVITFIVIFILSFFGMVFSFVERDFKKLLNKIGRRFVLASMIINIVLIFVIVLAFRFSDSLDIFGSSFATIFMLLLFFIALVVEDYFLVFYFSKGRRFTRRRR